MNCTINCTPGNNMLSERHIILDSVRTEIQVLPSHYAQLHKQSYGHVLGCTGPCFVIIKTCEA